MAASNASSFIISLLVSLLLIASMQLFRTLLASSQPLTIVGGFIGSLVFVALLTAISNFEMDSFGPNYQARIFPEVITCLLISMICSGLVHRVCVTTCLIFSLIALYYINRISTNTYGSTNVPATGYATQNVLSNKKKQKFISLSSYLDNVPQMFHHIGNNFELMLNMYTKYHSLTNPLLNSHHSREQHSSRSSHQLYRYTHEPISSNLLRRDIPPIIILVFFLFLIIIILSQILVVHTSRYGTNFSSMQKVQEELKQMDESMEALLRDNVLPIDKWRLLFHIQTYLSRFKYLFDLSKQRNKSEPNLQEQLPRRTSRYNYSDTHKRKTYCPEQPAQLKGRFLNENSTFPNVSLDEIERNLSHVRSGGQWAPSHCLARHRVAIIIPYRDRFEHLVMLLHYLHPILQRQELDYKIYVSEQIGNGTYNKGVLMNAAFIYASNEYDYQCFVFHDVDLIPEDDRNMYSCPPFPRHMSVAIDEMNYKLGYEELIGGVLNIRTEHLLTVNGYSNLYWGWGAEDDDLYYRLKEVTLKVIRPPSSIARYKMLQHTKRTPSIWNKRAKLLYSAAKRYTWDGISSVRYNITSVTTYPLYTHIVIDVGVPPPGFN